MRPHLPADDCPILRQAVFPANTPRTVVHHPRGGIDAGHQRGSREHRLPHHGGTTIAGTAAEGYAVALHPALEAAALRGVLRHPQETERIPVLHCRPGPATGNIHRYRNGAGMAVHQKRRRRKGGGSGSGTDTGVLHDDGRGEAKRGKERIGIFLPLPVAVPQGADTAGVGDGGGYAVAVGISLPHPSVGGCGHP